jgi:hypothetical protein
MATNDVRARGRLGADTSARTVSPYVRLHGVNWAVAVARCHDRGALHGKELDDPRAVIVTRRPRFWRGAAWVLVAIPRNRQRPYAVPLSQALVIGMLPGPAGAAGGLAWTGPTFVRAATPRYCRSHTIAKPDRPHRHHRPKLHPVPLMSLAPDPAEMLLNPLFAAARIASRGAFSSRAPARLDSLPS